MANLTDYTKLFTESYFRSYNITTVRVESSWNPLSAQYLNLIQQPLGKWTTRFGRFSYTSFDFWQEAYQFYCLFDQHCHGTEVLRTYPIYHPNQSYADYVEELGKDTTYFNCVVVHVPNSCLLDELCSDVLLPNYPPPVKGYYTPGYARL